MNKLDSLFVCFFVRSDFSISLCIKFSHEHINLLLTPLTCGKKNEYICNDTHLMCMGWVNSYQSERSINKRLENSTNKQIDGGMHKLPFFFTIGIKVRLMV